MKIKSISLKLGLWFGAIFISLLFILGFILYGIFTNFFTDYIEQDLIVRGNNHARNLEGKFYRSSIDHAVSMESGVSTKIIITDANHQILASSIEPDQDMKEHILDKKPISKGQIIESGWQDHDYMISSFSCGK